MEGVEQIPEEFSFEKEKEIARSFSKRFQWEMMLIGVGQATIWLSLWPLVIYGYISLFVGSLIAIVCACFAYLPSHEAQHGNFSRGNPKRRWIDSFVSHYTLVTLMFPHDLMRCSSSKSIWDVIVATQAGITKYQSLAEIYKNDKAFMKSFNKGLNIGLRSATVMVVAKQGWSYLSFSFLWLVSALSDGNW